MQGHPVECGYIVFFQKKIQQEGNCFYKSYKNLSIQYYTNNHHDLEFRFKKDFSLQLKGDERISNNKHYFHSKDNSIHECFLLRRLRNDEGIQVNHEEMSDNHGPHNVINNRRRKVVGVRHRLRFLLRFGSLRHQLIDGNLRQRHQKHRRLRRRLRRPVKNPPPLRPDVVHYFNLNLGMIQINVRIVGVILVRIVSRNIRKFV